MAQGGLNQLETARLTQAAQRNEFGVDGAMSAFKFSFVDPVRFSPHSHMPRPSTSFSRAAAPRHALSRTSIDS